MKRFSLALAILALAILACAVPVGNELPTQTTAEPTALATETQLPMQLPTLSDDAWTAEIILPTVNVRAKPCDQDGNHCGAVIGSLRAGSSVEILECTERWCRIRKPAGFVFRGCLSDNPARLGCQTK